MAKINISKHKIIALIFLLVYIGAITALFILFWNRIDDTITFHVTYKNEPYELVFGIGWKNDDELYANGISVENPFWGKNTPYATLDALKAHCKESLSNSSISNETKQNYERVLALCAAKDDSNKYSIIYISLLSVVVVLGIPVSILIIYLGMRQENKELQAVLADRELIEDTSPNPIEEDESSLQWSNDDPLLYEDE